jgi:replication factor A1
MGGVSVTARILNVTAKDVTVEGLAKVVYSGDLADETGKSGFSCWHDFGLKEGQVVKISSGYIKGWRGIPQLSFDERSKVEVLPDDTLPPVDELIVGKPISIGEVQQRGGASGAVIKGVIIDIRSGSGIIFRCPECNRVVKNGSCRIHNEVKSKPDLRIKAIIDDGTGAVQAIFNRDITEKLLKKDLDKCLAEAKEAMNHGIIEDQLKDILLVRNVECTGNITSDDYGLMMLANEVSFPKMDVVTGAKALLEEIEEGI